MNAIQADLKVRSAAMRANLGAAFAGFKIAGVLGVGLLIKESAQFNEAMTKSIAIMGDVDDAMRAKMEAGAKSVAEELGISLPRAAESYFFLASAGLSAAEQLEALPIVAKLATAGAFDMALATDLLTDAQSALGLNLGTTAENMRDMTRVSDVLVKANQMANASVEQFATSLTNRAAAAMRTANIEIEEGVAVLAAMADQGRKGRIAGNEFTIFLRDLKIAAKESGSEMNKMVFRDGEMRNMADIVEDMEKATAGMGAELKEATLAGLGLTATSSAVAAMLIGTSDKIRQYEEGLRDAGGATDEVAKKNMESFLAQLRRLRAGLQSMAVELAGPLIDSLGGLVQGLIRGVKALRRLNETTGGAVGKIVLFGVKLAVVVAVMPRVIALVRAMGSAYLLLSGVVKVAALQTVAFGVSVIGLLNPLTLVRRALVLTRASLVLFKLALVSTGVLAFVVVLGTLAAGAVAVGVAIKKAFTGTAEGKRLASGLTKVRDKFSEIFKRVGAIFVQVGGRLLPIFDKMVEVATTGLGWIADKLGENMGFFDKLGDMVESFARSMVAGFGQAVDMVKTLWNWVLKLGGEFLGLFGTSSSGVVAAVTSASKSILGFFTSALDWLSLLTTNWRLTFNLLKVKTAIVLTKIADKALVLFNTLKAGAIGAGAAWWAAWKAQINNLILAFEAMSRSVLGIFKGMAVGIVKSKFGGSFAKGFADEFKKELAKIETASVSIAGEAGKAFNDAFVENIGDDSPLAGVISELEKDAARIKATMEKERDEKRRQREEAAKQDEKPTPRTFFTKQPPETEESIAARRRRRGLDIAEEPPAAQAAVAAVAAMTPEGGGFVGLREMSKQIQQSIFNKGEAAMKKQDSENLKSIKDSGEKQIVAIDKNTVAVVESGGVFGNSPGSGT